MGGRIPWAECVELEGCVTQGRDNEELGRNMTEAAKGAAEIARNIAGVAEAARNTSTGAGETNTASGELARMAAHMQVMLQQFKLGQDGLKHADAGAGSDSRKAAHA